MGPSLSHNVESQTHSRVCECDGRPSVQVEPSSINRMVTTPSGVQTDLSEVVHPSCRSICHSPEPQPAGHHIAQSSDLHRLLSSFHRDRPKSSRNLPKWNLSVVLNELTKAHFELMKDTDLKHLTLKTAFLLALASGKRRSEIHAWVANKYLI